MYKYKWIHSRKFRFFDQSRCGRTDFNTVLRRSQLDVAAAESRTELRLKPGNRFKQRGSINVQSERQKYSSDQEQGLPGWIAVVRSAARSRCCGSFPGSRSSLSADLGGVRGLGLAPGISSAPALPRWGPAWLTGRRYIEWWDAASRSWSGFDPQERRMEAGTFWGDEELWSDPSSAVSPARWQSGASFPDTWTWISLRWGCWQRISWKVAQSGRWDEALQGCRRENSPARLVQSPQSAGRQGRSSRSRQRRWETGCWRHCGNQHRRTDPDPEVFPAETPNQTAKGSPGTEGGSRRTSPWLLKLQRSDTRVFPEWEEAERLLHLCSGRCEVAPPVLTSGTLGAGATPLVRGSHGKLARFWAKCDPAGCTGLKKRHRSWERDPMNQNLDQVWVWTQIPSSLGRGYPSSFQIHHDDIS